MRAIRVDRGISEDVFRGTADGLLRVFVAQGSHVVVNVASALLFRSGNACRVRCSSQRTS
jgi:hypothetical protein